MDGGMCVNIRPVLSLRLVKPKGRYQPGFSFFIVWRKFPPKREPNAAGHIIMSHEVATVAYPIETSNPAARALGITSIVLLEVPRLVAMNNL